MFPRYSIQETSNEAFREELEFTDDRSGKTYAAKWREHDHMHTVAGIIVALGRTLIFSADGHVNSQTFSYIVLINPAGKALSL